MSWAFGFYPRPNLSCLPSYTSYQVSLPSFQTPSTSFPENVQNDSLGPETRPSRLISSWHGCLYTSSLPSLQTGKACAHCPLWARQVPSCALIGGKGCQSKLRVAEDRQGVNVGVKLVLMNPTHLWTEAYHRGQGLPLPCVCSTTVCH